MALIKRIEIGNTGLVAGYWCLTHCQVDHAAGIAEFRLHGYPNREARAAGKAPLPGLAYRLTPEQLGLPDLHAVSTEDCYAAAKRQPATDGTVWFAGAKDC